MLIHAPAEQRRALLAHGRASPPAARRRPPPVIARMEEMGFAVTHLYGLTECYGPATICVPQPGLHALPLPERAAFMARQGVNHPTLEEATVLDMATMRPVPADGATAGRGGAAREHRDEGLSAQPGGDGGRLRGRLVPHRRPRRAASGRLHRGQGPGQGHRHLRRRERLHPGGGGGAVRAPVRHGGGGGGAARPEMGRGAACLRHAGAGCAAADRGRGGRAGARRGSRASRRRRASPSGRCRRPPPARSRSSSCGNVCATVVRRAPDGQANGPSSVDRAVRRILSNEEGC